MDYEEKIFDDWNDLKSYLTKFPRNWIYRGQREKKWRLESSWERTPFEHNYQNIEKQFINGFKRGALGYLSNEEKPENIIEWLSLMQHHGAPTRLLDFSNSPYIATYFAVEESCEEDHVLWIINSSEYFEKTNEIIFEEFENLVDEKDEISNENLVNAFLEENDIKAMLVLEPYKRNKRFRVQDGVFLCPGSTLFTFEENLSIIDNQNKHIKKIIIKNDIRGEILSDLNRMNINRESLFMNLDGFAKSLLTYFETELSYMVNMDKMMNFRQ